MVRTNPKGDLRFIGETNKEAAKAGIAPELINGSSATLHHINQNGLGNLVEASTRYHGVGKPGQDILHSLYRRSKAHPTNPVDRAQFKQDTKYYWQQRVAND